MAEAVCVIPGDGIGREVIPAALKVLRIALPGVAVVEVEAGWEVFRRTGHALPPETLTAAHECGAVLFGAVASPSEPVEGYRSPIVALRRALNVFANLRPVRGWPGGVGDGRLDLLIVRENTEGLYAGRERREGDTAISERVITRQGAAQVARVAFRLARESGRRVTVVHKANVLRVGDGLWREACLAVADEYPDVARDEGLVDAVAYHLVRNPAHYDLLLCPNLYGDILSDLAAGLGGGLGMAPSLSVGEGCAIAEPVHGAAPDIAGRGEANPIGAILSVALLARHHWEQPGAAGAIEKAVEQAAADGLYTRDMAPPGETWVTTEGLVDGIIERLALP
jgi:homoisocitrate dehydrogenase